MVTAQWNMQEFRNHYKKLYQSYCISKNLGQNFPTSILPVTKKVYFSFFFFFRRRGGGNQVFASQAQVETKEEIFWVKLTDSIRFSSQPPISYTKSTQGINTVLWPKQSTYSLLFLFLLFLCGTKSLHHRLRLGKKFVW